MDFQTIFSSNSPIDCHILKGRLERDGIDCFLYDDNMVWIFPFRAVALGGVKLKVPYDQVELAKNIINSVNEGKLFDEEGDYELTPVFNNEICKQNEILDIKYQIRKDLTLLDNPDKVILNYLNQNELKSLIESEKEFQELSDVKHDRSWIRLFYGIFDFEHSVYRLSKVRPSGYYLDEELVERYHNHQEVNSAIICPKCNSENVCFGYSIDYKWDIWYLILSFIFNFLFYLGTLIPLIRFKYHCFECGNDFKKMEEL